MIPFLLILPLLTLANEPTRDDAAWLTRGSFLIRTVNDYRYMASKDPSPIAGSVIFAYSYLNHPAREQWRFILKPGGWFKIKSESGFFLTQKRVLAPTLDPEAEEDAQLWAIQDSGDGYYTIKSKTGKYITMTKQPRKEGGLVAFANEITNKETEKWHLIKWSEDERKMTPFIPTTHGFKFANTFRGVDASYRYGGLCGGMVYSSMDYFKRGMAIPSQTYKPANRTPLQSFIYGRQNDAAMVNQLDKWTELRVNPFGWRDSEFFEWGLQGSNGGRIQELRGLIDANNPAPLGMYEGGTTNFKGEKSGDHQILAVGYSMGRYRGDMGLHKQDMKIFVYDPNYPGWQLTLVPDPGRKCYFYVEKGETWRTYFVDRKYSPKTPPALSDLAANEPEGSIRHIYATFKTGGDDLRGGNDNLSITVNYRDGTKQEFPNVNGGARWVDNNDEAIVMVLNRPVRKSDILSFTLTTSFGGGVGGDNWNLDWVDITNGGNLRFVCANCGEGKRYPFVRFTGEKRTETIRVE